MHYMKNIYSFIVSTAVKLRGPETSVETLVLQYFSLSEAAFCIAISSSTDKNTEIIKIAQHTVIL